MTDPGPRPERLLPRLLAPASRFLGRRRLPVKFAIMGGVLVAALSLVTYLLMAELTRGVRLARQEREGLRAAKVLRQVLEGITASAVASYPGAASAKMEETKRLLGQEVPAPLAREPGWEVLRQRFAQIEGLGPHVPPETQAAASERASTEILVLLGVVGDGSGLVLEDQLDAYHMATVVVERLPALVLRLAQLHEQSSRVVARGHQAPDDVARIRELQGRIDDSLQGISRSLDIAYRLAPGAARDGGPALQACEERVGDVLRDVDGVLTLLRPDRPVDPRLAPQAGEAVAASFALYDATLAGLDGILERKHAELASRLVAMAVFVASVLLLVTYLYAAFSQSLMRTVIRMKSATEGMVAGDLTRTLTVETHDELGEVVHAWNSIASRLRAESAQAREESARATAAEARLRESEERNRLVLDNALDALIVMDGQGLVVGWNPQATATFGWPRDETLGRRLSDVVIPERYRKAHEEGLSRFLKTGHGPVLGKRFEIAALRRDGTEFPAELSISPLATGDGWIFSAFLRDITARRKAEESLRAAEEKYRTIFENAVEGIFQTSPDGRLISVNPAMLRIFDYASREDLLRDLSRSDRHIYVEPGRREEFMFLMDRDGSVSDFESQVYRRDGSVIWISERAHAVKDDKGQVLYYEGTVEDTTERRRIREELVAAKEQAEEASRAKSRFLATMSHELRTPLNAIIGYSEMLSEEARDAGQATFVPDLQKIHAAGKHLLALINDILDLSKIEAGKMELHLERFSLGAVVRDVVATIQPLAERGANALVVTGTEDVGDMRADLTRLKQVLFNLLSNACKFTEGGRVGIHAERVPGGDGDRMRFRITDTGIGMTGEQMDRLFQSFTQADASTTRKYGGTGLGLVICRKLCQLMGGDVTVQSEIGKGSTFTVDLPAEAPLPLTTAASAGTNIAPSPFRSRAVPAGALRILVIDDDPSVRELLEHFLSREGFAVLPAGSGEEGLRLARERRPDLITLDVMMPSMDGWSVLAQLKSDPKVADIPVVMVTIVDDQRVGFALGAADYVTKPVDFRRLASVVARFRAHAHEPVLVVDDEPNVRDMMRRMLEREGYRVDAVGSGPEAIEHLGRQRPGLVILDLMMPGMDGFEVTERIRADASWRDIPIVVLTAKELTREDKERLDGHVERVLQKGAFNREQLEQEVRRLLSVHHARAEP